MNTLDQPLCTLKPKFDPAPPRVHFEHTFARILELRDALSSRLRDAPRWGSKIKRSGARWKQRGAAPLLKVRAR